MINKYKVSENRLSIMEIERFAVHDGPGIRTVVFLQGCPFLIKRKAGFPKESPPSRFFVSTLNRTSLEHIRLARRIEISRKVYTVAIKVR